MKPAFVTQRIHEARHRMRKSERKVADFVLAQTNDVIHMRIVDLANRAEVSEPTVVRFCRAIGYDGFQGFKLELAQQLAASPSIGRIAVTEFDSIAESSHKVFDSTVDTLLKVRDALDPKLLDKAVEAICSAKRVEFYAFGASSAVAVDAQHKFFRLQIATAALSDPHIQKMSAMSLGKDDVIVAISQSGRTKALVEIIELVKANGVTVIGLAPSNTPVTNICSIPITVDVKEEIEIYTPLSSRIAHLAVFDVLAIGVAQRKGPSVNEHLHKLNQGMQPLRITPDEDL